MPDPDRPPVTVALSRLPAWVTGFEGRHGTGTVEVRLDGLLLHAADGATAVIQFPPWRNESGAPLVGPDALGELAHIEPQFAVVVVRRGGYALARFAGQRRLAGKVSVRHVNGRTAAGGWSQQRYARRRANQSGQVVEAAVATARGLPSGASFIALGGDRSMASDVVAATASLAGLPVGMHLSIGTLNRSVLDAAAEEVLSVRVTIREPSATSSSAIEWGEHPS